MKYLEGFYARDATRFTLVFKSGERSLELGSSVINVQCFFNGDISPMRNFDVSNKWRNAQERRIVFIVHHNFFLK